MSQSQNREPNWYAIAHQILISCCDLAERVREEGVKLYLTDTDLEIVRGFEIVLKNSTEQELLALCLSAGLYRKAFDAMLDLYNFKKGSGRYHR